MTQIPSKMNIESRDINTTTRTNYYHSTLKVLPLGSNHGNTSGWPLTLHSYIDSCIRALDQPLILQEHSLWFHMKIVVSSISSYSDTNRSYLIYGKKNLFDTTKFRRKQLFAVLLKKMFSKSSSMQMKIMFAMNWTKWNKSNINLLFHWSESKKWCLAYAWQCCYERSLAI